MKDAKISIVIPVYNAEAFIADTVYSIQSQSYEHWKLILVDDGSTDKSVGIISEIASADNRIFLCKQANSGPSTARNNGIQKASSDYITFIDADDKVHPDYLKALLEPMKSREDVDLVCAGYFEQNEQNPKGLPLHDFQHLYPYDEIDKVAFVDNIFNGVSGVLWAKLFRTELIKENNIQLHPKLKLSEDLVFVIQYATLCRKIALVYKPVYFYNRLGEQGLSRYFDASYFDNIILFSELVLNQFEAEKRETVKEKLRKRTAKQLLKTFKDQSSNRKLLKKTYQEAQKKFDLAEIKKTSGFLNKSFVWLLFNEHYTLASLHQKVYHLLKKIKNA